MIRINQELGIAAMRPYLTEPWIFIRLMVGEQHGR
jgi:hypothetical protein